LPDLKETITSEGVWRIRRRKKSAVIEVFKNEESGYGDVLSREFVDWRTKGTAHEKEDVGDVEAAKARLLDSVNNVPS